MMSQSGNKKPVRWADIVKAVLALILIGIVFSRTNIQQVTALRSSLDWRWLALGFLLYCLVTLIKGTQYWLLLRPKVMYDQTLKIVVIQNALTNLVANTAGLATYLTMFRLEQNVKLGRSGTVFIVTKVGDLFSMGFYLLLSASFVWDRVDALHGLVAALLVVILVFVALFWTVVFLRRAFVSQVERLSHALRLDRFNLVRRGLGFLGMLADMEHQVVVQMLSKGLLVSLLYMSCTMLYFYSRTQIFHIPLDFWAVLFIASLMQLISIIPLQIFGGLGVSDLTSIYLYELFGVTGVDISAIVIGLRVLFYLFNLGVLLYIPADILAKRLTHRSP